MRGGGTVPIFTIRFGKADGYSEADDIRFPTQAVANLAGFQVGATQGDSCVAAVVIDPSLHIISLSFVDESGETIPFSEFLFDPAANREFGRKFRVYRATALADIDVERVEMEINVAVKTPSNRNPKSLTRTRVASFFAESRIATGKSDGASSVEDHLSIVNPLAVDLCLGPEDPVNHLSTCPEG